MASRFRFVAIGMIAIGLAMGVAFGLGVAYGKGDDKPAESGGMTQAQIQAMVGGGGPGAGGAGAGGAGAGGAGAGGAGTGGAQQGAGGNTAAASARSTAGRITAVQGQTVTIELRPGLTQKLNLGTASVVNKLQTGAGADLKEGSSVLVSGTRLPDGSFDVTTINIVTPELVQILAPAAPAAGGTTPSTTPNGPAAGATPAAPAPAAPSGPSR